MNASGVPGGPEPASTHDEFPAAARPVAARHAPVSLFNRELSLLDFNRRVLALSRRTEIPLLERLRFLCIVGSNLDEFFEIRVARLRSALRANVALPGMTQAQMRADYAAIAAAAHALVAEQYAVLNGMLLPALAQRGVRLLRNDDRTPSERAWVADFFAREVRPVLTPIGLDPAHPFPKIASKTLNFIVELSGRDAFGRETGIAIVKAPRVVPRVVRLPREVAGDETTFFLLSSALHAHLADLFPGREILGYSQFRLTRDADLWIDEEEVKNLRQALAGELPQRQFGAPLRLEVAAGCPPRLAQTLLAQFELDEDDLYRCDGPVNMMRLASLIDQVDDATLKYPPFSPGVPARLSQAPELLSAIRRHDILLHHPYEAFDPVVELVRCAAEDPDVVSVKQTVYRTGMSSALMEALVLAARRGKEVTVVVELMARFDEEANMNWAERLEQEGAQVVYGVYGLKTHAKLVLLLRRERDEAGVSRLVPYAHLGTGNYHPRTTGLYSDFGLLTGDPELCADVNEVFLHITSLSRPARMKKLLLAPFTMHRRILAMISREARHAREGKPARIVAKMNALVEEQVIRALYAASTDGVTIELIVRGACALKPGVPGMSENIRVRSILGRFLEHHRVWMFDNDGAQDVWLASADWMGRNLFRRIEVAFPLRDPELKARVIDEGLMIYLADNVDAWDLASDGRWVPALPAPGSARHSAQESLLERLAVRRPAGH